MKGKLLFILGGIWHDFEGFRGVFQPFFEKEGWQVEATYDLNRLLRLKEDGITTVVSYTCLGPHREGYDDTGPERMEDEQVKALSSWVKDGGGLLAVHAATVLADSSPELGQLMGGVFVSHPPAFHFTVYPLAKPHPMIQDVGAFSVLDEFYIQELVSPVELHMVAIDRGVAHPMVWSKTEGKGRVAHIAMGHSAEVWLTPAYQRLMLQAVSWLEM